MIGHALGPYRVVEKLGEGGMGEVYRGVDTRLDRAVAIKVLPARLSGDLEYRERFEREARAISRLNHPHICTVYDIGQQDGVSFMVMELVDGETLRQWMKRQAQPDVTAVTRIATQVAHALGAAHAAGIVHRDIKPDNIVVKADGSVKVLDFGVAKTMTAADTQVTQAATAAGMIVGTTQYMAPEQARGVEVDARADVFSLGIVLYEMLAGEPPFTGSTATDMLVSILQHDPPPVTRYRPDAGSGLSRVVATCLAKEPAKRYATGLELATELQNLAHAPDTPTPLTHATPPSIAVLPFVNMSADPENEYFCDGIAEDLIGALTKIERLHVAARTSSFAFKGRQVDLKEMGRILNVRSVLEGSVRKAGARLRITAQLVNIDDGYQLWSERYDRQLEDVFAIQDEISIAIVEALKVRLLGEEKAALVKRQTASIEAFELYLRGRFEWHSWTPDGLARARTCFEQAIALDPSYALAHAGLADCILAWSAAGLTPYRETLPQAMPIAERGVALDPQLDEAWNVLGIARLLSWDFVAAREAISRALELNPRLAHAQSARASTFMLEGRYQEALAPALRSVELDPLAPLWGLFLMMIEIGLGRHSAAEARAAAALEIEARNWTAHWVRGLTRVASGDFSAALPSFHEASRLSGRNPRAVGTLIHALANAGEHSEAERELADLEILASQRFVPRLALATAYTGLGDFDRAFAALDQSFDERDNWLRLVWWNPAFFERRRDSRMQKLLDRLGLVDAALADGTLVRS